MKNKLQQFCIGLEKLDASEDLGLIADLYDLVELIEDTSFTDEHIAELNRRINTNKITRFNTFVLNRSQTKDR